MAKTKYPGVYTKKTKDGDISYVVKFRDEQSKIKEKVAGRKSEGCNEIKALQFLEQMKEEIKSKKSNNYQRKEVVITDKYVTLEMLCKKYIKDKEEEVIKEQYLDIKDKRLKTHVNLNKEKSRINFWYRFKFFKNPLKQISPALIEDFLENVRIGDTVPNLTKEQKAKLPKYSGNSKKLNLGIMKTVMKHCNIPDHENPFKHLKAEYVPKSKEFNIRKNYLKKEELKKLLDVLLEKEDKRDYMMCLLGAATGARPDSILKIKIKDLMFNKQLIRLFDFKRKIFYESIFEEKIHDRVLKYIKTLKEKNPKLNSDDYLFTNPKTNDAYVRFPKTISVVMDDLFNQNLGEIEEKDKIVPYSLRHTFATLHINEFKTPIYEVSQMLNHASINTTLKHYVTYNIEKSREFSKKFTEML